MVPVADSVAGRYDLARAPSLRERILWVAVVVGVFHLVHEVPGLVPFMVVFFMGLLRLARAENASTVIYAGWLVGLGIYGPQLFFFWSIFHQAAIILWLILGSWLALAMLLQRFAVQRLGPVYGLLSAPVWWMAVEYFRSELYPLRFSWLNAGYLSPELSAKFGMYGAGGFLMLAAACFLLTRGPRWGHVAVAVWIGVILLAGHPLRRAVDAKRGGERQLAVAGVQFEEGDAGAIIRSLDALCKEHPETMLFVLSEYSFGSEIPPEIKAWCAQRGRFLVAGGKQFLDKEHARYRNTAFVIGADGAEVFQQAKSQPIQFFDDGLPAERQAGWNSPWGRIGVCICYDLSYTRVTDELIRQGAQMIIVPTMDVESWGRREHVLHARVAPTRAAEYGVPIFRLCSSGISQAVQSDGQVVATAPFPGQGETLAATLRLPERAGRLPVDRFIVWPCLFLSGLLLAWQAIVSLVGWRVWRGVRQSCRDDR